MDRFEQRLLAEGVRAIEGDSPTLATSVSSQSVKGDFEQGLLSRAVELDREHHISPLFNHFKGLEKRLFSILAFILFILGASSVQQLFFTEQGTQINFFWAFALFFIPNLISLCLWIFLFFRSRFITNTWLARFSLFLLTGIEKRFNPQAQKDPHFWPLFKCYFTAYFSGFLGRYQLSALSHLLWLGYIFGATLMLIVMLATHQVDFIWQTSILSLENFQWLTKLLAYLPDFIGLTVPDASAIQQSNITMINSVEDAQASRFAWASLLISSLLIYGLIPRLILWLAMRFLGSRKKIQFSLNLSLPYYVQLRQLLKPNVTSLGISDPDSSHINASTNTPEKVTEQSLPSSFFAVPIELSQSELLICERHVKQCLREQRYQLENITDFQAQQSLVDSFPSIEAPAIVIYVSIARVPDRGLSGFIRSLTRLGNKPFYLLLIDDRINQVSKRRSDWYQLAAQANIPLDNIIHLKPSSVENYE